MFPESIKYAKGNIVAFYAVLGSVKLVVRSNWLVPSVAPRWLFCLREANVRHILDCEKLFLRSAKKQ